MLVLQPLFFSPQGGTLELYIIQIQDDSVNRVHTHSINVVNAIEIN